MKNNQKIEIFLTVKGQGPWKQESFREGFYGTVRTTGTRLEAYPGAISKWASITLTICSCGADSHWDCNCRGVSGSITEEPTLREEGNGKWSWEFKFAPGAN